MRMLGNSFLEVLFPSVGNISRRPQQGLLRVPCASRQESPPGRDYLPTGSILPGAIDVLRNDTLRQESLVDSREVSFGEVISSGIVRKLAASVVFDRVDSAESPGRDCSRQSFSGDLASARIMP